MVRIWHFHCCGLGSIPGQGTEIPQAIRPKRGEKKDIINRVRKQLTEWEKISASHVSEGSIYWVHIELLKLNSKKMNNLIQKWAEDFKRHCPKEHIRMANNNEKMLNITNYVGNANQSMTCHLIPIRMATVKENKRKQKSTRAGEEVGNRSLVRFWWNVTRFSCCGKLSDGFCILQNV